MLQANQCYSGTHFDLKVNFQPQNKKVGSKNGKI